MEHFYFNPIKWYYRQTILSESNCSVSCSWYDGGGNLQHDYGPAKCSSKTTTESYEGGYVDGHITVLAGATVSLTGHVSNLGIKNTAPATYPNHANGNATASKLDLPTGANPYTLQVKQLFDAASFPSGNIGGIPGMAQQAVLGLWTGVNKPANTDGGVGGTFLIGNATQFQNKLTLNSGTNGGTLANYYYHTNTEQRPGGWNNESITTTDAVVHDVNISGTSGGTHITFNLNSTGDMTIENTQCAALNFNGKFAPTIGGDGALRINPTTWDLVSPMRLTHLTVFSPTNLPNTMSQSTRGFTHFAEDVDLNFTTKTGFLLLEGGKITFDKKYTYNRGGVGTTVTGKPASQIGSHQVVLARGGCVDSANIKAIGDVSSVSESQLPVLWWANQDIQTYSDVLFNQKDATHGPLTLFAGQDFVAYSRPKKFTIKQENEDEIFIGARRDIRTQTEDKIERVKKGRTKMIAGRDIDIQNSFLFDGKDTQDPGDEFLMYAGQDIWTNSQCISAPMTYQLASGNGGHFDIRAGRNITTKDKLTFLFGNTDKKVRNVSIAAQGGNVELRRATNYYYDSDSTILISAERDKPYSLAKKAGLTGIVTHNDPSNMDAARFLSDGHIHFDDSLNIERSNDGTAKEGETNIFSDYHLRTAMVNIKNTNATNKNKTTFESHLGDVWLGYSVGNDGCAPLPSPVPDYDKNLFYYSDAANSNTQWLKIRAGYQDQANTGRYGGGNIYVAQMKNELTKNGTTNTEITIPFSNEYYCESTWSPDLLHKRKDASMMMYEHAGIIFGLGHCGKDKDISQYAPGMTSSPAEITKLSLEHIGNKGDLKVDAGKRGNIIINRGAKLNFQDTTNMTGNAIFRTRFGDIDMREKFDADTMRGSLLFLAQVDNLDELSRVGLCGCAEERNNVYLQDFQYRSHNAGGSVFVGADNNIKLNYGGLQNIGTRHDPFLSKDYKVCSDGKVAKIGYGYNGTTCSEPDLHCDAIESVNRARKLTLYFDEDSQNKPITSGGFAAVASDYIDVYKEMEYRGGKGSGMGSVPGTGTLHGEMVSGYGLYMKTQGNKDNWTINIFKEIPNCPTSCVDENCRRDYLHMVSRMTFHDNAIIKAHNQQVYLGSPVIETFGKMELDTKEKSGGNTDITLQADSLIFHDDFVKIGKKINLSTWSGLKNDKPIMKFGHMRHTPPFRELKKDDCNTEEECEPCHYYIRGSKDPVHMLDTITIKFGDEAYLERLNTVIFDHTVLTCLTDSFDHIKGAPVLNAQIRTDTFKIRNQVDLFADEKHERDAHLELISEEQMGSKDYAGIYTKHLHMEPIGACGVPYSELWTSDDLALDVVTTSIFGGFGFIHSDVHVENGAHLNAGFTSLRLRGLCYEQMCGTQRMKDLRLDVGAQLHFSVGTTKGLNGEYSDAIEVDRLTTYGSVDVNIEIRPCEKIEKRCYPIIYYKSITPNSLNQLKLNPRKVMIDGEEYPLNLNISTDGIVYVCVGDAQPVDINRTVTIPSVSGVKTDPGVGIWDVKSRGSFKFKATFSGSKPLAVRTNRTVKGAPEMLTGTKNANGEYEYIIPNVQQDITLSIGPDHVANELLAGTAVWSHGEMIYIRVDRADIASIYSVAGQLVRKVDLPEGDTSIPMSRGAYVITLKDGSVHKVIVK